MIPYLACSTLSSVLGCIASNTHGAWKRLFCFAAVVPFCLLAAFRADSVGTDVLVYAWPLYQLAEAGSYETMLTGWYGDWIEPLFSWLTIGTVAASHSFEMYLFVLQLFVAGPIAFFLRQVAPHHIGSGLFVYSTTLFGFSLNGMRQSIAAALLCLVLLCLMKKRRVSALVFIVLSVGFHSTGVLGLVIWPIFTLFGKEGKGWPSSLGYIRVLAVLISAGLFLMLLVFGVSVVEFVGKLKPSFASQVRGIGTGGTNYTALLYAIVCAFVFFLSSEKARKKTSCLLVLVFIFGVGSQFGLISQNLYRVGIPFLAFAGPFYALLLETEANERSRALPYAGMIVSGVFYFVYIYAVGGWGEIIPYQTSF